MLAGEEVGRVLKMKYGSGVQEVRHLTQDLNLPATAVNGRCV